MSFLGVGAGEALLVFIIALIVIGPNRFPEAMRTAGRWYRMARAYSTEVMKDVRSAVDDIEREVNTEAEGLKSVRELTDISADLRAAQRTAEEAQRGTEAALEANSEAVSAAGAADAEPSTPRPIRPSQRVTGTPAAPAKKPEAADPPKSFDPFNQPKGGRPRRPSTATGSSKTAAKPAEPAPADSTVSDTAVGDATPDERS
ncbi:MAG: twin-arginine translocase TatA/TatE family subunit [Chloroflexi bacterium]|nr:twin-arginine translocase TatA/TatE family subunit [Chloroflexota bacterium]MQC48323.1 twin-arginine translocase TatA/TatE family subunit [Chloroflexota bacterium]